MQMGSNINMSSANMTISQPFERGTLTIWSFTYAKSNNGPRIDPWGPLDKTQS